MNQLKVFLLMAVMTVFLVLLGGQIGGPSMALWFFGGAVVMNVGMFWFSDRLVLRMYKAKIIEREDAPELFDMVDELRRRADLPMPIVAIAPKQQPNAFATGRSHSHAVVCVTAGLMQLMSRDELAGVIAHELAHIKHRHMLVSTIGAVMAGAITMIARWGIFFGGGENRNPIVMILIMILGPLAAIIIQMAISRTNEFQADETGARIAGSPDGLANALRRLESAANQIPMDVNAAGAQLAIVNPLRGGAMSGMTKLFRTHPPTEDRIAALRELRGTF
ncbi:MAG: protease HtpX [Gemmatimonadales bacterium]|nr:MAG: protease HtpX [Gemmatimonadales bacterium]